MTLRSTLSALLLLSFTAPLAAAVGSWTPMGPDGGAGLVLAADPTVSGTLYAGMLGGIFRSFDGASTWTRVSGLPPGSMSVIVDPLDPAHLYAVQSFYSLNVSFFFSADRGATWSAGGAFNPATTSISALAADPLHPGTVYAASFARGLFRSADGGRSWQLRSPQPDITSLAVGRDGTLYAGTAGNLTSFLVSGDGGATWVDKSGTLPRIGDPDGIVQVVLDPHGPGTLYLDVYRFRGAPGSLFRSTDGGESWTALGPHGTPAAVAPDGTIYTSSQRSADGGRSWIDLAPFPAPFKEFAESFAFDPASPRTVYALTFVDGVFVSRDQGASWAPASRGLISSSISAVGVDAVTPSRIYASTQGQGFFRGRASGRTWLQADPHQGNFLQLLVDPNQAGTLYTSFPLQKSTDGGSSWQPMAPPPCPISGPDLGLAPTSPATLYFAHLGAGGSDGSTCGDCSLAKSIDGGASWSCVPLGSPAAIATTIVAAPSRPDTLYASDYMGLWKSGDGGAHWTRRRLPRPFDWTVLAVDPTRPEVVFISSTTALLASTNSGRRWFPLGRDLPAGPRALQIDPRDPRSLYASVNVDLAFHLYHSGDGGVTWTSISDGLPFFSGAFAIDLAHPGTVFAGTSFDGVQSYTLPAP